MVTILCEEVFPGQEDCYAVFNVSSRDVETEHEAEKERQDFARYTELIQMGGKLIPSIDGGFIAFRSKDNFILRCITSKIAGEGTVSVEDPLCIDEFLVVCIRTVLAPNPISGKEEHMPIPCIFFVDHKGNARLVSELEGELVKRYCKNLIPLGNIDGESYMLLRPAYAYKEGKAFEKPKIILCRLRKQEKLSFNPYANPEVVDENFLLPSRGKTGIGPSAMPVSTPYGKLFFYHEISWPEKDLRRYEHRAALFDPDNPLKLISYTKDPIIAPEHFEHNGYEWIPGAVYFRTTKYCPITNSLLILVSVGDYYNYWVSIPMPEIMNSMRPIEERLAV